MKIRMFRTIEPRLLNAMAEKRRMRRQVEVGSVVVSSVSSGLHRGGLRVLSRVGAFGKSDCCDGSKAAG